MRARQKITTSLFFDGNAEEAANYYTSIFKNSKILSVTRFGPGGPAPAGSVMVVNFQIEGQEFIALNGGPQFKFTEAISLLVSCDTQKEVDELWGRLTAGGEEGPCGWLKDRFGLSWQIIPSALMEMMQDKDARKASRVMEAMMQMKKIDIARLQEAYGSRG